MEQMKIGRFAYYIGDPARSVWRKIKIRARKDTDKITGRWWCDGCKTYHPGRVIGFYMCRETDGVCGKHITAEEAEKCESITRGGYFGIEIKERFFNEANGIKGEKVNEKRELYRAASIIRTICKSRTADTACAECPFGDMCKTEPYTWEV